ncbi:B-cell CLL/lymphoma 6 member B protein [Sarcophilus harrisii]|uniref:BCL6B transcription repressor n=1 Tax=Sarcophilus harrisii TaxID=9305 RepID=G3VAJ4_SARHA|nr:B-cell CLL/lymphoma 6 member B protein [Sarcophilus harrisii]
MDSAAAAAAVGSLGYVREFTRHATDVLWNLNELRLRGVLTDVTLLVGGRALRAHKAVLIACSGFFYSIFRGRAGVGMDLLSLPGGPEAGGFAPLLDFMYTSRLLLSPANAPAVLAAATYLQMDHVVEACHRFIQASYEPIGTSLQPLDAESQAPLMSAAPPEGSPHRFEGHPDPPTESHSCFHGPPIPDSPPSLGPSPCNWKKYKFIILNSRMAQAGTPAGKADATAEPTGSAKPASGEEASSSSGEEGSCYGTGSRLSPALDPPLLLMLPSQRKLGPPSEASCPRPGNNFFNYQNCEGRPGCPAEVESRALTPLSLGNEDKPYKCQLCRCAFRYKGNLASHRTVHTGEKPYHCAVCGARFNRPANLKTHSRIHSGEKPYKCETCGSRFVQVAHLRAHVLIHTGEKPYPCPTCGTRFRHLQTLKSHVRIHTGEKPYHCEPCNLHFRHKSQLRLHLRQKHGAATNTKVHYHVLRAPC